MPIQVQPHGVRTTLAAAAIALWLAAAGPARAAECRIEVTGPGRNAWERVARARSLSALDCQSVVIETTAEGARLTFTAPNGQAAQRMLVAPDEVGPALDALRVTIPVERPPAEPSAADAAAPASAPAPPNAAPGRAPARAPAVVVRSSAPLAVSPAEPVRTITRPGPIIALLGGLRGSGVDLVSPVLTGSLTWPVSGLELGAFAACEVQYADPGSTRLPDERGGAVALGMSLGLRSALGPLAVLAGLKASYALLFPSSGPDPATRQDDRFGEARIGLALGAAVPRSASLRFRAELGADLVIAPQPGTASTTPARAVSIAIGLEMGGR